MPKKQKSLAHRYPRCAGVLLHPTSLPAGDSDWDSDVQGVLGASAYHFVDMLQDCGAKVWQILPLVPTHSDLSPYMGLSVFAGNPDLISLELLQHWQWLDAEQTPATCNRQQAMRRVRLAMEQRQDQDFQAWQAFNSAQAYWLDDYSAFVAIRAEHQDQNWSEWPAPLRDRDAKALQSFRQQHAEAIADIKMQQFIFYRQWGALKTYANDRGISLFGDMPIFVAHDSAEVWANPDQFDLNPDGKPRTVAGVPPDYFSATGQRWGNPLYQWAHMKQDDFHWWKQRVGNAMELYDLTRIDHFRGFQAFWEIDAKEKLAVNGHWVKAPGKALFNALTKEFDELNLIAEDLGVITDEVIALRDAFMLPGMKILQFAFDGNPDNPYLPHNYEPNSVVYTGTHDNDTCLGWYAELAQHTRDDIDNYTSSAEAMPWKLIRLALASTAFLAVIPMQDLMELGQGQRMNTPGSKEQNWRWRFQWTQLPDKMADRFRAMNKLYSR